MCIIEIIAAELADRLVEGGTKFQMEPDRVIWPDGTTTKKATPPHGKKGKKVPPAVSKHGLYGTIVAQFGNKKKNSTPSDGGKVANTNVLPSKVHHLPVAQFSLLLKALLRNLNKLGDVCVFLFCKVNLLNLLMSTLYVIWNQTPIICYSVWKTEEHVDLLVIYKNMFLSGLKKDNFKELSKRMSEVGWDHNNDQCRQQVIWVVLFYQQKT